MKNIFKLADAATILNRHYSWVNEKTKLCAGARTKDVKVSKGYLVDLDIFLPWLRQTWPDDWERFNLEGGIERLRVMEEKGSLDDEVSETPDIIDIEPDPTPVGGDSDEDPTPTGAMALALQETYQQLMRIESGYKVELARLYEDRHRERIDTDRRHGAEQKRQRSVFAWAATGLVSLIVLMAVFAIHYRSAWQVSTAAGSIQAERMAEIQQAKRDQERDLAAAREKKYQADLAVAKIQNEVENLQDVVAIQKEQIEQQSQRTEAGKLPYLPTDPNRVIVEREMRR